MIMATRSRAKQSIETTELKHLPYELLHYIFGVAQNQTNYPYKHMFGTPICKNGRKKCLLPLIAKNYQNAYKGVPATRNNAVNLVTRSSALRSGISLNNTKRKLSNNMKYPATRSAVSVRRRVKNLTS